MRKFLAAARCCLQSELIWQKSLDNDFLEKLCVKKRKRHAIKVHDVSSSRGFCCCVVVLYLCIRF